MFKAAKAWSFLESWLDGLLICKYKLLFLEIWRLNTKKSRKIYSAFSYMYFDLISRPRNIQQGDL